MEWHQLLRNILEAQTVYDAQDRREELTSLSVRGVYSRGWQPQAENT